MTAYLLQVKNLSTYFYTFEGLVRAVDGLSFDLFKQEILGIVGESGSGKTVTALSILRLVPEPPGKIVTGEALFRGENLLSISESEMRNIRGNQIAMIFQDPMTSLNPVFTIGDQIIEAICLHQKLARKEAQSQAIEFLAAVGIPQPEGQMDNYPHQFSGGMRQRVMIAMALSCRPQLLIADEPTTALDVTIEAEILELIIKLKEEFNTSVILVTHNLGLIARVADRVLVIYAGKPVEYGDTQTIFHQARHPYTWGLINSIPRIDLPRGERLRAIRGLPPSLVKLPSGCSFHPRCDYREEICLRETPQLREISPGHKVACHIASSGGQISNLSPGVA